MPRARSGRIAAHGLRWRPGESLRGSHAPRGIDEPACRAPPRTSRRLCVLPRPRTGGPERTTAWGVGTGELSSRAAGGKTVPHRRRSATEPRSPTRSDRRSRPVRGPRAGRPSACVRGRWPGRRALPKRGLRVDCAGGARLQDWVPGHAAEHHSAGGVGSRRDAGVAVRTLPGERASGWRPAASRLWRHRSPVARATPATHAPGCSCPIRRPPRVRARVAGTRALRLATCVDRARVRGRRARLLGEQLGDPALRAMPRRAAPRYATPRDRRSARLAVVAGVRASTPRPARFVARRSAADDGQRVR